MRPRHEAPPRRRYVVAGVLSGTLLVLAALTGSVWGSFTGRSTNFGNEITGRADWKAPAAGASLVQKSEGGTTGYVRAGGAYRVFANVTDSGNPSSGTATVTANLTALTVGQTAATLAPGSFTADGQSYGFRGPSLTAQASLAAGTYTYTLASADNAGNGATHSGFSVVVDNAAPSGSAVQSTNKAGGTAGRPELGDSITLTYSEPIDPNSVLSGWTGTTTNVVARIDNDVFGVRDTLTVYNAANTSALPLGVVDLGRNDYVSANRTFGATGTPSTMSLSGNAVTVVLGTASGPTTTAAGTSTMTWYPAPGATDRAGNPASTTTRIEIGTADKEF